MNFPSPQQICEWSNVASSFLLGSLLIAIMVILLDLPNHFISTTKVLEIVMMK